ncbi:unnamed protein product [Didymodactylos carnosus]|uniref:Uncharacterized protein n=1 Tax=Didymodactylos carnosus TaxID=1234261 RepID=A0A815PA51_9BILA|nr:unnamed protein product [Didymodactylos carnosus]CAF4320857.1 unnamed protein product [Didymodactylos carnosus]
MLGISCLPEDQQLEAAESNNKYIQESVEPFIRTQRGIHDNKIKHLVTEIDLKRHRDLLKIEFKTQEQSENLTILLNLHERRNELAMQLAKLEARCNAKSPPPALKQLDIRLRIYIDPNDSEIMIIRKEWDAALRDTKLDLTQCMIKAKNLEILQIDKNIALIRAYLSEEKSILTHLDRIVQKERSESKTDIKVPFLEKRVSKTQKPIQVNE